MRTASLIASSRRTLAVVAFCGGGLLGGMSTAVDVGEGHQALGAGSGVRCEPSPTKRARNSRGQILPGNQRTLGDPTIVAGAFQGHRALLSLTPDLGSKLYYQLAPDGPRRFTITAKRLDGPGRGLFEVHRTDARGRTLRVFVPVLRLDRERVRRSNSPRRGGTLLGQPGSITLPAAGCYQLRIRWPGAGWDRRFVAR